MLEISNLSFSYRHSRLFDDLSFAVESGKILHVRGANGVGKSTLLAVVAGLLEPSEGKVEFFPEVKGEPARDRREYVEYLPAENNGLFLKMDAVSNLMFWGKLRGLSLDADIVYDLLDRWNLNHPILRDSLAVEKYSTGMKRRLALARLELSTARCWLLDEPVYGLDDDAEGVFKEGMRRHLQKGGSIVIVSHGKSIISDMNPRVLELGR